MTPTGNFPEWSWNSMDQVWSSPENTQMASWKNNDWSWIIDEKFLEKILFFSKIFEKSRSIKFHDHSGKIPVGVIKFSRWPLWSKILEKKFFFHNFFIDYIRLYSRPVVIFSRRRQDIFRTRPDLVHWIPRPFRKIFSRRHEFFKMTPLSAWKLGLRGRGKERFRPEKTATRKF